MKLCLNWKRTTFFLALIIGVGAGLFAEPSHPALADQAPWGQSGGGYTTGRMCVFLAPNGAHGLGHVGWGFRDATGFWFFGSLENRSGGPVAPGGNTYIWYTSGTEQQMYNTFAQQLVDPGTPAGVYHQAGDYTQYSCANTNTENTNNAMNVAEAYAGEGYGLPIVGAFIGSHVNNVDCLTETQDVLNAYNQFYNTTLDSPDTRMVPSHWFYALPFRYGFEEPADIPSTF